jgi:Flp pilus assembly pilin Flp
MMTGMMGRFVELHRDERGAEGLEKLLIIAAIVLPLLGLLIIFRNEIKDWVVDAWKVVTGEGKNVEGFTGGKLAS